MLTLNRRQFLKGITAGGLVTASSIPIVNAKPNKKIGVALLGLGYYSRDLLAPALQLTQHCELVSIITGSPNKIPVWQRRYQIKDGNVYSYDDMHRIADNPEVDVIYVVTPTATHMRFAIAAAKAGKHVWCEKPMAMTANECQIIEKECQKNSVSLSIGYRMMHEPNTRTFAQYASTRPFGAMQTMVSQAGYAGSAPPADNWRMKKAMGGGALYDMGVYCVNGVRFISKLEPIAVMARHEKNNPKFVEVDDTSYFRFEFADGITAECGTSVVKSMNRLRVNCEKGWYQLSPMQSYSGVAGSDSSGVRLAAFSGNQQANQMDNDSLALLGPGPFLTDAEMATKDIHIIEKIFESAASGKRVLI